MMITSATDADMEIFLTSVGEYLGRVGAETTIDLYTDVEISEPEPKRLFTELRQAALAENSAADTRSRRKDPYMGVPLDLTSPAGITYFSRLAHRTIGCEASLGRKLLFSTVENERLVSLDIPDREIEELKAQARQAGATTLSHVA
ncbi:hypothetical protein [Streptomyces sp. IBSBF 3136]|uniref:hypothetical protein n=1 Tax=Streptomyces sp. IBSBF 3136 TaxID=2903524 RepID=UPI002FDC0A19